MRPETDHGNEWEANLSGLPRTGSSVELWKFTTCMLVVFISLFCAGGSAYAQERPVLLIFDTDLQGDCDDAGALAVAHYLTSTGEAEPLFWPDTGRYK